MGQHSKITASRIHWIQQKIFTKLLHKTMCSTMRCPPDQWQKVKSVRDEVYCVKECCYMNALSHTSVVAFRLFSWFPLANSNGLIHTRRCTTPWRVTQLHQSVEGQCPFVHTRKHKTSFCGPVFGVGMEDRWNGHRFNYFPAILEPTSIFAKVSTRSWKGNVVKIVLTDLRSQSNKTASRLQHGTSCTRNRK